MFREYHEVSRTLLLTRGHQVHTRESEYQGVKAIRCRTSHHFGLRSRLVDFGCRRATCGLDKSGSLRTYCATGDLGTVCDIQGRTGDRLGASMLESRDNENGNCMLVGLLQMDNWIPVNATNGLQHAASGIFKATRLSILPWSWLQTRYINIRAYFIGCDPSSFTWVARWRISRGWVAAIPTYSCAIKRSRWSPCAAVQSAVSIL
jgi:hypothetical protein